MIHGFGYRVWDVCEGSDVGGTGWISIHLILTMVYKTNWTSPCKD